MPFEEEARSKENCGMQFGVSKKAQVHLGHVMVAHVKHSKSKKNQKNLSLKFYILHKSGPKD
jgi:hypothetical protein